MTLGIIWLISTILGYILLSRIARGELDRWTHTDRICVLLISVIITPVGTLVLSLHWWKQLKEATGV